MQIYRKTTLIILNWINFIFLTFFFFKCLFKGAIILVKLYVLFDNIKLISYLRYLLVTRKMVMITFLKFKNYQIDYYITIYIFALANKKLRLKSKGALDSYKLQAMNRNIQFHSLQKIIKNMSSKQVFLVH